MLDKRDTLKVLLVEDHLALAQQVSEFLDGLGWTVDHAERGQLAIDLIQQEIYDVVILDLNLPDMDGLEVCQRIRNVAPVRVPVLMLTARDSMADKTKGFTQGADDYVTKPVDLRELVLRCQAMSKRQLLHQTRTIDVGSLQLDPDNLTATREGKDVSLTHIGFNILLFLARQYPKPVTRTAVIHHIWGDSPPDSNALKSHIYSLRTALDKPFDHPMLVTIPNVGFQLVVPDEV